MHKFLEILLEIRYLSQIGNSRIFRGKMQVPAERLSGYSIKCPLLRLSLGLSRPQLAAGEKNFAPKQPDLVKIHYQGTRAPDRQGWAGAPLS